MTETKKKIKYLVADTTAFINAVPLNVSFIIILYKKQQLKHCLN